jgi:hypothetical protein
MKQREDLSVIADLEELLEVVLGTHVPFTDCDGTYIADGDDYTLSIAIADDTLEILNIETHGARRMGSDIVTAIHSVADDYELEVMAKKVQSSAIGFWTKMGYEEGSENGVYHRT